MAKNGIRIPIANPNVGIEEAKAVFDVVKSGWLNEGKKVKEFENAFARYVKTKHAVACFNGTVGLHLILMAHGVGRGDEVIAPSLSFASTATSVLHCGAKPVFAEIKQDTFNIDPADVEKKITKKTKAIMAVHYAGQSADMDGLRDIAERKGVVLIEDAAEAHGAVYKGRKVGSLGDAALFSFTPTKNITTGEGGVITTNDEKIADKLRVLKNHGQDRQYHHVLVGYNYRMTEMQAAIGIVQLKKLSGILKKKRETANLLSKGLSTVGGITVPYNPPDRTHTYMIYTIKVDQTKYGMSRDDLAEKLRRMGVQTKIYFPPIHLQPMFRDLGYKRGLLPVTEKLVESILSLPCHTKLTKDEINYIVDSIR